MEGPSAAVALAVRAENDLRPRTVGEILDASFALYRRRFGRLLLLATVLGIPTLLLAIWVSRPYAQSARDYMGLVAGMFDDLIHKRFASQQERIAAEQRMQEIGWQLQGYGLLTGTLQAFSRGVTSVAMALVAWEVLHRRPVPPLRALAWRSLQRSVPASALHLLLFVVTTVCAVCPPIWVLAGALLAPACAVVALEQGPIERSVLASGLPRLIAGPLGSFVATLDAIARSFVLGWHAMSIVRSTFLLTAALLLLAFVDLLAGTALGLAFESFAVFFVAQHYIEVLLMPAIGIALALWYVDLRVRREALDLVPPQVAEAQ